MTLFAPQSHHARPSSSSPLFDRLASSRRGARGRLAPITTRSLLVDRASNPVLASILDERAPEIPADAPRAGGASIDGHDSVAQLIVRLLDDETPSRRSRRRHR